MEEHPLIVIAAQSRLAEALGGRSRHSPRRVLLSSVYSLHHQVIGYVVGAQQRGAQLQVVGYPAPGLRITAVAPDGMIEGMEDPHPRRLWMAVGFHAEFMVSQDWSANLFTYFVQQSLAYAALPADCLEPYRDEVKAWLWLHDQLMFSAPADAGRTPLEARAIQEEQLLGADGEEDHALQTLAHT
jgi:Peptidase C26